MNSLPVGQWVQDALGFPICEGIEAIFPVFVLFQFSGEAAEESAVRPADVLRKSQIEVNWIRQ